MTHVPHRGRPRIIDQLFLNNLLRPYHLKTFSVLKTAELTGCARQTVQDRFAMWDAEAILKLNFEFQKSDTKYQVEYLNLNQTLIDLKLVDIDEIELDIKKARENGDGRLSQLLAIKDKMIMSLQSLNEKRFAVKIEPGAKRVIDRILEDRIKEHVQSTSQN